MSPSSSAPVTWLTLSAAAKRAGVSQQTMRKWIDRGDVDSFRTPGGHRRIDAAALERFLTTPDTGSGTRGVVLVVDDDPASRALVRECLIAERFEVVEAASARDGLLAINRQVPDLVILDVYMPGVDGWEMLRRIRNQLDSTRLPVIVFSGKVPSRHASHLAHAQGFTHKPFDPGHLVAQAIALTARD
jgi:excisionase family DNA binding protein